MGGRVVPIGKIYSEGFACDQLNIMTIVEYGAYRKTLCVLYEVLKLEFPTMKTPINTSTMTPQEFTTALAALGWKQSDFCRKTGVSKQTPSRWALGQTPIQQWVRAYLGAMLDIKRLHAAYIETGDHTEPSTTASEAPTAEPTPPRLAHLLAPGADSVPET